MLRDEFGILALGQAGGNISNIFEKKYGYTTVYVNSSSEDLDSINGTHKIKIPNADGAAKDRKKILHIASEHIADIVNKITNILSHKYILCIFSVAGGTGSGLSIPLISYLSQIGRIVIPVVVLPDEQVESAKASENAYNACVELLAIQNLGATFLLDNSRFDKFAINERFAKEFDTFLNLKNISRLGNLDNAERKQILSCPGVASISKVSQKQSTAPSIMKTLHNGIYAEIESNTAYYLGINTSNKSLEANSIANEFASIYDVFMGVSEATSVVIVSGLQFPRKRILRFKNKFEQVVKNISTNNFIQTTTLEPLQSLTFVREEIKPSNPIDPRAILMGLLNN